MDDEYEGIPLTPKHAGPIGFEEHHSGVGPSQVVTDAQDLPPPPPLVTPPAPPHIGFEGHEPPAPPAPPAPQQSIAGFTNRNFQGDFAGVPDDTHSSAAQDQVNLQVHDEPTKSDETEEAMLYFEDGVRRIDFVLVYKKDSNPVDEARKQTCRNNFHENIQKEGLQLEMAERQYSKDETTHYVKVHATWEVLTTYAEIMNLKMPLAENDLIDRLTSCWSKCPTPFDYDSSILPEIPDYFTASFSRAREHQFIIKDKDTFFSPAQRSLITHQILSRAIYEDFGDPSKNKFGIKKMLNNGSYIAAFPLHEGEYTSEHSLLTQAAKNQRHLLYETWARPKAFYKFQPLDHIRLYFGEKIGIYFAWLGHYTGLLIPAGLVGLAIFIYGCARMPFHEASNEICDDSGPGNFTMCPLCDESCSWWKLGRSCVYSRVSYLFDNEATVAFAAFMALWSTFFIEMWKRREAEIKYDWDVEDFEEEETIRPEYEASVRRRRVNPVSKIEEPYLSFSSRVCRTASSLWVILFMLCVVIAAVFGVIVYRLTVSALLYSVNQATIREQGGIITSVTASLINLICIIILGKVYQIIAEVLTNFETHRTLTEWEDSFTLKMFLFQFVNHFSSLFYIAFFKGKLIGRPGNYNHSVGRRQEECDPAGCLIELCIQLAIIMVGKQTFNNVKELLLPKVMNWFKSRKVKELEEKKKEKVATWEKDYIMESMPSLGLFDEYLEMVIQYGFVTIFVAAFPLAPLFALINNIIEIRLDAYKFITQWRRPLAMKAQDIGIWFGILQGISQVAIMTNALIIAFTSDFIPKLVYMYAYNPSENLNGYINFSLSVFNVSDFEPGSQPRDMKVEEFGKVIECRYRDYRNPPGSPDAYDFTIVYWHILAARLAFIIFFVLTVQMSIWLIAYIVPDVPRIVKLQMLREKYLAMEAVVEAEHRRVGGVASIFNGGIRKRATGPSQSTSGEGSKQDDKSQTLY
ncbi:hypothetical protein BsWGS_12480 [Bradybaena similaris]